MCFSSNVIERQAFQISEMIQQNSTYKIVSIHCLESNTIEGVKKADGEYNNERIRNETPVVTQIILQNEEGINFTIKPTSTGLKFAKGEITYKEYKHLERIDSFKLIGIFAITIPIFFIGFWVLIKLLN